MSIPSRATVVTVTGTYVNGDGTTATGTVRFDPSISHLTSAIDEQIIVVAPVSAILDGTGSFTASLIATDDPDMEPSGWTWRVLENVSGVKRRWNIEVPYNAAGLDLSEVAPAESSTGAVTSYATLSQLSGHEADTTSIHGISDTSLLETTSGATAKVTAHSGATDPHADRAYAASLDAAHLAASDPHADRAYAAGYATSAVADHSGATDPHGDRSYASGLVSGHSGTTVSVHGIADMASLETSAGAALKVSTHTSASDPHGDRSYASGLVSTHTSASDPHADRAYAVVQDAFRVPYSGATSAVDLGANSLYADNVFLDEGTYTDPTITDTSGSAVAVSSYVAVLRNASEWDSDGRRYRVTVPAVATLPVVDNALNYIYTYWDGSGGATSATTSRDVINYSNTIPVARVYMSGGNIEYQTNYNRAARGNPARNLSRLLLIRGSGGIERESGLNITETTGRVVNISSGYVWFGLDRRYLVAIAQGGAGVESELWYHSGAAWTKADITAYNNTQYDNGTGLVELTNNRYAVNWVYRNIVTGGIDIVLGTGDYTQAQATASLQPAVPDPIYGFYVLCGRIIVQKGASTAYLIETVATNVFRQAAVTSHDELSALDGGNATSGEYYHLDLADYTNVGNLAGAAYLNVGATSATVAAGNVVSVHEALADGHGYDHTALRTWHAALANRHYAKAKVVAFGASTIEGQGCTVYGRQMLDRVMAQLRADYPTSGSATGGIGFVPPYQLATGITNYPAALSGGAVYAGESFPGWAARTATVAGSGHTITYTLPMSTSIEIIYSQYVGGGVFSYAVDGGSATSADTNGTLDRFHSTGVVSLGSRAAHTVAITYASGGTVHVRGVMVYDGDETIGITYYNGGASGYTTTAYDWLSSWWTYGITAIQPHLVIIDLGRNDYTGATQIPPATMRTNLESIITKIRANCSSNPSIVLYVTQRLGGTIGGYTWDEYRAAYAALAAADSGVCLFDMSTRHVSPQTSNTLALYNADLVHLLDKGHSSVGDIFARFLGVR